MATKAYHAVDRSVRLLLKRSSMFSVASAGELPVPHLLNSALHAREPAPANTQGEDANNIVTGI